jgi:hypothetical protein
VTYASRYVKVVEWSEEDGAFVGQCPGIIGPCCHGSDGVEVYRQLCEIVEEWMEITRRSGRPLSPPTAGTGAAQKFLWRRWRSPARSTLCAPARSQFSGFDVHRLVSPCQ